MPLISGSKAKFKKGFSENIKIEMSTGKPQKQAVAIALDVARKSGSKISRKKTKMNKMAEKHFFNSKYS